MAGSRKEWCDAAIGRIRFWPDRSAVRKELAAHIQERSDDLVSRGYTRKEADVRALEAMGDPEEVGRQLDAVHKPLLGWLWMVSRWMAAAAALAALWALLFSGMFGQWGLHRLNGQEYLDPAVDAVQTEHWGERTRRVYWGNDGQEYVWGRYTFRVEKAAVWGDELVGYLSVDGFLPWEDYFYLNEAYAVDDLGNCYQNFQSIFFDYDRYEDSGWKMSDLGWADCRTLTAWWYDLSISGLDPEAEWIELRYDRNGHDLALRIDLTGGEGR